MKKPLLSHKLKSYSAIAGSVIAMGGKSNAQVIYTDVNPDSTTVLSGTSYLLDLDNDGTFDFDINLNIGTSSGYTSQRVAITGPGSNAVAGDTVGMYVYPFALNSGDTVQASLQFNYGSFQSMGSYFGAGYSYGNFLGTSNKYLALSFYKGINRHFGWARVDVNATATSFTIKDYAYNATPDQFIIAGDMGTGIHEKPLPKDVAIYSHSKNVVIRFTKPVPAGASVQIVNVLGQTILNTGLTEQETILPLNEENTGIYFVTLVSGDHTFTQKVNIR